MNQNENEQRHGEALSRLLQSAAPERACLSPEEIDAVVEQRLDAATREACLAHIASCERCLRSFGLAAELKQEERAASRRRLWRTIPLALAALLVLAISVTLTRHEQSQMVAMHRESQLENPESGKTPATAPATNAPPSPTVPAEREATTSTPAPSAPSTTPAKAPAPSGLSQVVPMLASLPPAREMASRRKFGFAEEQSVEKALVMAGADLLEARVATFRGRGEQAVALVQRAAGRVPANAGATGEAKALAGLAADYPANKAAVSASRLDRILSDAAATPYLTLGGWCQAVGAAAKAGDSAFFATEWFTRTGNALAAAPLKNGAAAAVKEILAAAEKAKDSKDLARLGVLVQELKEGL